MPTDICEAKRMLRKEILSKRRHLDEEICQTFGRQFAERIVGLDEYKAADTILCYASCKGEADTWKLIEKALEDGKRVALPRVTGPAEMHFYKITTILLYFLTHIGNLLHPLGSFLRYLSLLSFLLIYYLHAFLQN